jgi:hypothetical protein
VEVGHVAENKLQVLQPVARSVSVGESSVSVDWRET